MTTVLGRPVSTGTPAAIGDQVSVRAPKVGLFIVATGFWKLL